VKLSTLNLFVTGATGYIGGSVATRLVAEGHRVRGLARDGAKADALAAFGIDPVVGDLANEDLLSREARAADVVVNAASADDLASVEVLIAAMSGSGKLLVHTSCSSVVGDDARGNSLSSKVFDEATPFVVAPAKQARHQLNQTVHAAAQIGMRTAVICPTLIYGAGRGLNKQSIQIPFLVDEARRRGAVHIVGTGVNRWSTVHIDDLTDVYSRVVMRPDSAGFYFAENGEVSYFALGTAIAERLSMGAVVSMSAEDAAAQWGAARAFYTYGSNSRVQARRAREELGWEPRHGSVLHWIRDEMPL